MPWSATFVLEMSRSLCPVGKYKKKQISPLNLFENGVASLVSCSFTLLTPKI